MPTTTADQQIDLPIGTDPADNPVAFVNCVADIESRLVRRYTNEADRTARMLTLAENAISGLAAENRIDAYDGANHISLYTRSMFSVTRLTADHNLTLSSTALQSVTGIAAAMPTAGTFGFRAWVVYSSSAAADIKFGFLLPAGGSVRWGGDGVSTAGGPVGDINTSTQAASDATSSYGGAGVGTVLRVCLEGTYVAGGTAGNLQLRAAQFAADATQSVIHTHTRMEVWRLV